MVLLQPNEENDGAAAEVQGILQTLRDRVAPLHSFEVNRHLMCQFMAVDANGEPTLRYYPAMILARPTGLGGDNNDEHEYAVRFFDEENPWNVRPEALTAVEEFAFNERLDNEDLMSQHRHLEGSIRIQVAFNGEDDDDDDDDEEAHFDDTNFYYYCLNSGEFSTEARYSVLETRRVWITNQAMNYTTEDPNFIYHFDNDGVMRWRPQPGQPQLRYRGNNRRGGRRRRNQRDGNRRVRARNA